MKISINSSIISHCGRLFLFIFFVCNSAYAANSLIDIYATQAPVSLKTLAAKIKDAEANVELSETTKIQLLELYRKTSNYLEQVHTNNAMIEALVLFRNQAPEQVKLLRKKIEINQAKASRTTVMSINADTPFVIIEQQLFNEQANLAAVKAKLSDLEQQLMLAAAKPNENRQRLIETRRSQETITAQLLLLATANEISILTEASRWKLEAQRLALRSEIGVLDQELLSLPVRIDLLEAERDINAFKVEQLSKQVTAIQKVVNIQRQIEAEKNKLSAEKTQHELEGKHVIVQKLAEKNADLTRILSQLTQQIDNIVIESNAVKKETESISDQFKNVRKRLDVGGFGQALGRVLYEQQRQLPRPAVLQNRSENRAISLAEVGLLELQYTEENKVLNDIDTYINQLTASIGDLEQEKIKANLEALAKSRQQMLKQLINLSRSYLRSMNDYEFNDQALLAIIQEYKAFLAQRLLWIRSGPMPNLATIQEIPVQLVQMIRTERWQELVMVLDGDESLSAVTFFGIIITIVLFWKTKTMHRMLALTGMKVGRLSSDSIVYTFYALGLSFLLAASWPSLLLLIAWMLSVSEHTTLFTESISSAFIWVAVHLFGFRIFRAIYAPKGVAIQHFHIPILDAQLLYRELGYLMRIFLPSGFIFSILFNSDLALSTGELGRLLIVVSLIALTVFFQRITTTQKYKRSKSRVDFLRLLLIAVPLILIVLAIIGYVYTAALITMMLVKTLWFILGLIVVQRLAVRWIVLAERRLAFKAALTERAAIVAKREELVSNHRQEPESEEGEIEEPEVDLPSLSEQGQHLLKIALIVIGVLGLLMIWSDVLPAFTLLEEIKLWNHATIIAGEQQIMPVTLLDLSMACLILFVTIVASRNLPSLLEIIMLQASTMTAGSRYTVTTITNYIIFALGLILFFNRLGVDWSKLQWLVAALGVGIGFGLQEIVANFISGIIILFERPIRVGDMVSIGNNDGLVVRIRIRATTIRNFDRKELLVPNKEFITGQLINWTLSDQTTRIVIPVGLAYGGDVEAAFKLMLESAQQHPYVLSDPPPSVVFDAFGDNALSLKLRCFVADIDYRVPTITELHKTINQKFNDAGLVIAFPQRDIHLDFKTPLDVRMQSKQLNPESD
ncbi:hypothetical protein AU255_09670 [Methyloprofundus sedimenti]|uniref:Mechanosensitive ion channel protein MscS n=1 Tax=Methyloprofundus sedimenti TaxID=1420851 RepID=A0A1V8M9W7_9GAMM|nr:mechanosensitive ion channel domain-containing protein [Methyloprofundus sedimenti]OQK18093.1 hypothetical protein AU255_09670 [Methyloprofundus sedimenti]